MADNVKQTVARLGLERALALDPAGVEAALKAGAAIAAKLPRDLHWTDEPANTFGAAPRKVSHP